MFGCNSNSHAAFMRTVEYWKSALWHLSEGTEICWTICDFERLNLKIAITNIMEQNGRLSDTVHGNSFLFNWYFLVGKKKQNIIVCFILHSIIDQHVQNHNAFCFYDPDCWLCVLTSQLRLVLEYNGDDGY
jgi:hypothetical protein